MVTLLDKYVGQKYGKLVVIKQHDFEILTNGHRVARYLCNCECGSQSITRITALKNGSTKSCGCSRRESLLNKNVIDLTDNIIGCWKVITRNGADEYRQALWACVCICGNNKIFKSRNLRNNIGLKCDKCGRDGNCNENVNTSNDLIGSKYGRWTILGEGEDRYSIKSKRRYRQLRCICDCGEIKDVDKISLLNGRSQSCGCLRIEKLGEKSTFDDLSGRVFGEWKVIHRGSDKFYKSGGRSQMYFCECSCGNTNFVARSMLISGQSQSCGCSNVYKMETFVKNYLNDNNITHESQVIFDDLLGEGNQHLSYDFKVLYNDQIFLIECQGEQHFHPVKFFGGKERFERQKRYDKLKKDYAEINDYILIEIDYKMKNDEIIELLNHCFNIKTEKR